MYFVHLVPIRTTNVTWNSTHQHGFPSTMMASVYDLCTCNTKLFSKIPTQIAQLCGLGNPLVIHINTLVAFAAVSLYGASALSFHTENEVMLMNTQHCLSSSSSSM